MKYVTNSIRKTLSFILNSYKPWMIAIVGISLVLITIVAVDSAFTTKKTIEEKINDKQAEILVAEQKAETDYQQSVSSQAESCKRCREESNTNSFDPKCNRICQSADFVTKQKPIGLMNELNELVDTSKKSGFQLFMNNVFVKESQHNDMPLIYFVMMFVVGVPVFYAFLALLKNCLVFVKLLNREGRVVATEVKQMPSFQKYLLILLGLLLIVMLVAIIVK